MTNAEVLKLTPHEQFLFWIKERHAIYVKRSKGLPKPWTTNEALQSYFFTNPYRENDKVTVWFKDNYREPSKSSSQVLMGTVIFRWFNLPATGELLLHNDLLDNWSEGKAIHVLREASKNGTVPVFTGAYMIKAGNGEPGIKIPSVCAAITNVWKQQQRLINVAREKQTLQDLWRELTMFNHLGPFMSYEIVCDLRYTDLLKNAKDVNTWANPGPGALRGLLRMSGGTIPMNNRGGPKRAVTVKNPLDKMIKLLHWLWDVMPKDMPRFELREVEHSACEFDKMCRALDIMTKGPSSGKMKRTYNGKGN